MFDVRDISCVDAGGTSALIDLSVEVNQGSSRLVELDCSLNSPSMWVRVRAGVKMLQHLYRCVSGCVAVLSFLCLGFKHRFWQN